MSIKRFLVPISGNQLDDVALDAGVTIARQLNAHLVGMHLRISSAEAIRFANNRMDTRLYSQVLKDLELQDAKEDRQVEESFNSFMQDRGVVVSNDPAGAGGCSASWITIAGEPEDSVALHGGAYDLLLVSHPAAADASTPAPVLDAAIFSTARPVLLASGHKRQRIGDRVLIAWNRGIQSARAVASAFPFLESASKVVILTVTTGAKQGPDVDEVAENLEWHGIASEVRRIPPDSGSVAQMLMSEAHNLDADLLVMGAYAQRRMRDRVIGGVTREILAQADFPVLMAR